MVILNFQFLNCHLGRQLEYLGSIIFPQLSPKYDLKIIAILLILRPTLHVISQRKEIFYRYSLYKIFTLFNN